MTPISDNSIKINSSLFFCSFFFFYEISAAPILGESLVSGAASFIWPCTHLFLMLNDSARFFCLLEFRFFNRFVV